jgi:hypothetical protein
MTARAKGRLRATSALTLTSSVGTTDLLALGSPVAITLAADGTTSFSRDVEGPDQLNGESELSGAIIRLVLGKAG